MAGNASSVGQVDHLRPGAGGHRLLVTSRSRLDALSAQRVDLDTLSEGESLELMSSLLSALGERIHLGEDPQPERMIVQACGGLPLALRICVSLLRSDPERPREELAAELAAPQGRLATLDDGHHSVSTMLDLVVDRLTPEEAWLFDLLGAASARVFSTESAAVLTDLEPQQTRGLLTRLASVQLVQRGHGRRWVMHDLIADYAQVRAAKYADETQRSAVVRLLEHYADTVEAAVARWAGLDGVPAEATPPFRTGPQAWRWLEREHPALVEATRAAEAVDHDVGRILLPLDLYDYLVGVRRAVRARALFAHSDDSDDQGWPNDPVACSKMATALSALEDLGGAVAAREHAVSLFRDAADPVAEAYEWTQLARLRMMGDQAAEAASALRRALGLVGGRDPELRLLIGALLDQCLAD
ncbi:hypothetical protein [Nocardiopsis eucommiae]|uniref:hypothetical protein n=1 Tax=Nocardiopsis eucommiae TaxID=2831970 RepID=UPI003D75D2B6